jgi:translation initiation factor IF-1
MCVILLHTLTYLFLGDIMTDLAVANTIIEQIGSQALYMLGASQFLGDGISVKFRIGKNAGRYNEIKITLLPDDIYKVELFKWQRTRGYVIPRVTNYAAFNGVYADMLHAIISSATGMALSITRHYANFGEYEPDEIVLPEEYRMFAEA